MVARTFPWKEADVPLLSQVPGQVGLVEAAAGLATGPDGLSHVLWTAPDENVALWGMDSTFNVSVAGYGPLTDGAPQNTWTATAVSAGP